MQNVCWRDIAVDNTILMRHSRRVPHLQDDPSGLEKRNCTTLRCDIAARDPLLCHVEYVIKLAYVEYFDNLVAFFS